VLDIKLKLSNSTESELLSLQSQLRNSKADVAAELQRNVFKKFAHETVWRINYSRVLFSYADFMLVSKEINVLENEMLEFKDSLAEWKSMPSLLHIEESTSAAGDHVISSESYVIVDALPDRRRNVRSSVADLRILYANQMQNLHLQIEGAAKYVPTMPGRHIITEMDGVLALNAATYKVDHAVKFVVLDDAVLVARRRRRRNNTESEKLVAERCWMLGEMLVLDSKDSASGC
jgi:exocyst complex component 8